jgi:hypothetical protein
MKSVLLVLLGFVVGGVLGLFGGGAIGTGVGAGIGIATGVKAGACLAVEAAKEKGFITAEQIDEVFAATADLVGNELPEDHRITGSDAECQQVIADMRQAAAED